jgi:lipoate-protein ligase A
LSAGSDRWRLIVDSPADGAWNMAVDEAILEGYLADRDPPPPTLRLYGWKPPALSLGKSQAAAGTADLGFLRRNGIDLVRRPTGGRAVLHEHERTYAVIGSLRGGRFGSGVLDTYRLIAAALESAIRALGVEALAVSRHPSAAAPAEAGAACFNWTSAHEIAVGGRKLIGSAQLRRGHGFLQHGSIPVAIDAARLRGALGGDVDESAFTDLRRELGPRLDVGDLDEALRRAVERCFDVRVVPGTLTEVEHRRATRLRCWKHLSTAWVLEGRIGDREAGRGALTPTS